ncbi:hypothetical protein [Pukyongiella litopenaei]|uniref:Uncharacterized protein n=1 Tax=Pukyongiella litopenaei TaxID=2605946 RepID=A0A5C2H1G6_9RHOB|nr:hypothetical protein [Pukyongiella litopenaei]QEP30298.1 hypothetical protein C6Y53_18885 [Pukyongiella litopenaei]
MTGLTTTIAAIVVTALVAFIAGSVWRSGREARKRARRTGRAIRNREQIRREISDENDEDLVRRLTGRDRRL